MVHLLFSFFLINTGYIFIFQVENEDVADVVEEESLGTTRTE